jgi:PAN domain
MNYNNIDEIHKKTELRIVSNFFSSICSRRCKDNPGCRYFTIDTRKLMCYLKSEKQSTEKTDMTVALVSGNML